MIEIKKDNFKKKIHRTTDRILIPVEVPGLYSEDEIKEFIEEQVFYLIPVKGTGAKIEESVLKKSAKFGYGVWEEVPGQSYEKRLDLMPPHFNSDTKANQRDICRFFTLTDLHLTDKEFPVQGVYSKYEGGIVSAYSEIFFYTPYILNAAIQTINEIHEEEPFDFGLSLGDNTNNSQYNELRWSIDIFDGEEVKINSGNNLNEKIGPRKLFKDSFMAEGLSSEIKWYQVLGNHDHFKSNKNRPSGLEETNRRFVSRKEWIGEFFNTSTAPVGHGFTKENRETGFASYTFDPIDKFPLKVIVLDDTQDESDENVMGYAHGSLDNKRFKWLKKELEKGQKEEKLMIVAAHIPMGVKETELLIGPFMSWSSVSEVKEEKLIKELHAYPNLILWMSGHRHRNLVTPFVSPDPLLPECGFWEVETASLRDFPQQFRMTKLVLNDNGTLSVFTECVDPAFEEGSYVAISKSIAMASQQIFKSKSDYLPSGVYNAELIIPLSEEMQKKLTNT